MGALPVGASDLLGPRGLYFTSLACDRLTAFNERCSNQESEYFNSWSPCNRPLDLQNHASNLITDTRLPLMVSCRGLFLCRSGFRGPAADGSLRRRLRRGRFAASVSFATGCDSAS